MHPNVPPFHRKREKMNKKWKKSTGFTKFVHTVVQSYLLITCVIIHLTKFSQISDTFFV